MTPHRLLALAGLLLGAGFLILQTALTVPARLSAGDGLIRALVFLLSFFTILTNLAVVLAYVAALSGRMAVLNRAGVRAMLAAYMVMVAAVYHLMLAPLWTPSGLWLLADHGLHTVAPALYLLWWITGPHPRRLAWAKAGWMLLPPVAFTGYVLVRGALTGRYPYPFLDASALGYGGVALNLAGMLLALAVLCLGAIAIERALHRAAPSGVI